MLRSLRHRSFAFLAGMLILVGAAAADTVSGSTNEGFGRLLFTLTPADQVSAQASGAVLTITFNRKVGLSPEAIAQSLPGYIASGRMDPGGKTYRFALSQTVRLHTSASAGKFAVDLAPPSFTSAPPDLPPPPSPPSRTVDMSKAPAVKVRSGAYHNFTRVVFDWPRNVPYAVFPGSGKLTLRFDAIANLDFSAMDRQAPPWVKSAGWHASGDSTLVDFVIDSASGFHDFRDGTHVVVDVLTPKTDADSYNPPGDAKPSVTALNQTPKAPPPEAAKETKTAAAKLPAPAPAATGAPAKLAPNAPALDKAPPPPAAATPAAAPQEAANAATPAANAPASPDAAPAQLADGKLTKDGAVLLFPGAGRHGAAVFTRGLSAWIILQDSQPLDVLRLKTQLGNFPSTVEASSGAGTLQLRIGLKSPQSIAAYSEGSDLKVVIAAQVTPTAMALGFARDQENPTHSTISMLLPGATRIERVIDPLAGDELLVVPGVPGRYVTAERRYIEFSALPTASGVVLMPYVDDLAVSVQGTRVTVTRPGGLSLTPPSMPTAGTPEGLVASGVSPSFLDFAKWHAGNTDTFLATERRLRAAITRMKPETANKGRLAMARFFLANDFAAEALGMIAQMQQVDPGLQGDAQLQTMKAAASLAMGRYRDAHNALAGTQFDSDRHAALWRGLADAALEDWESARANLERAAPVIKAYTNDIQVRARLATAEAGMALGRLETADAALENLPKEIGGALGLQAKLDRARLFSAERRTAKADMLFNDVEQGGNEALAVQAIYFRVTSGLSNGTLKPQEAINALERLRFRWRGDGLELKSLRKLASIYFSQKRWHEGLATLRVAASNFRTEDAAMQATDDMRGAFVNLFLKGEADKMAPVRALGLFYDFIELTPIGSDGDEMIRRMADRLVKVDLLGPAADLLNYQVTKRLDGVARAQVATRLAMVQLMDHKPAAVIDTLRTTQISTLPDDVMHQRLLMEARALAEQKRFDHALDIIAVDQQPDTVRLRAEIYWKSGNWPLAGQKAEEALGERYKDSKPLGDSERELVMRAAVSYSLANDQTSLDRLRNNFGPKMAGTRDASGFAVLTQRIDLQGVAFRDAAAKVASVDTLKLFMQDIQSKPLTR